MECTCKIKWQGRYYVEYCTLHSAAPELLEACKMALPLLQEYRERVIKGDITGKLLEGDYEPTVKLRNAIAKAEAAAPDWGRVK